MDSGNLREYEALSPFEIKDLLASLATRSARASAKTHLDAGRGNPNWNATSPREAFFLLGQFAIAESKRVLDRPPGIGGTPQASGIAARLAAWLDEQAGASGASLLRECCRGPSGSSDSIRTASSTSSSMRCSATITQCPTACWHTTSRSFTSTSDSRCSAHRVRPDGSSCTPWKAERQRCATSSDPSRPIGSSGGRHHCARCAHRHAVPRDSASRGLRPEDPLHRLPAGESLPIRGLGARGLGIELSPNPLYDHYYGLVDFEFWARKYLDEDIVRWMKANVHPLDLVFRLAQRDGIVCLNGGGFEAPNWSIRISFANLADDAYAGIGSAVRAVARVYRRAYEASRAEIPT